MNGAEIYTRFCGELSKIGKTKKDFCAAAGINQSALSNWSKRGTMPSAELTIAIAKYLNCSTDYVLGLTNVKNPNSSNFCDLITEEMNIVELWRTANEDEKRFLLQAFQLTKKQTD